jgi:hypothetical protein
LSDTITENSPNTIIGRSEAATVPLQRRASIVKRDVYLPVVRPRTNVYNVFMISNYGEIKNVSKNTKFFQQKILVFMEQVVV